MSTGSWNRSANGDVDTKSWNGVNGRTTDNAYTMRRKVQLKGGDDLRTYSTLTGGIKSSVTNYGYGSTDIISTSLWPNNNELQLLGRLVEKVKGHDFYGSSAFAQIGQTVNGVIGSTRAVIQAFREVKRLNIGAAIRALASAPSTSTTRMGNIHIPSKLDSGSISSTWLALQYGWLPLLSDISAAMDALEVIAGPPRVANFRASSRVTFSRDIRLSSGYPPYNCDVMSRKEFRVQAVEQLSVPRTLGLMDPATLLWESLPFSFVLDWFIPVGNYLQTLSDIKGMSYGPVYYTLFSEFKGRCKVDTACGYSSFQPHTAYCNAAGGYTEYHTCGSVSTIHGLKMDRGKQSLVVPKPSWKSLDKAFSLAHMENAAALIHQLVRSAR